MIQWKLSCLQERRRSSVVAPETVSFEAGPDLQPGWPLQFLAVSANSFPEEDGSQRNDITFTSYGRCGKATTGPQSAGKIQSDEKVGNRQEVEWLPPLKG